MCFVGLGALAKGSSVGEAGVSLGFFVYSVGLGFWV